MYSRLVMYGDLNPGHRLFGGKMMAWIDEAAALYTMDTLGSKYIVTAKISEVSFINPVLLGDMLTFNIETLEIGTTSITVKVNVSRQNLDNGDDKEVCSCQMVFVNVDPDTGKSKPHGLKNE